MDATHHWWAGRSEVDMTFRQHLRSLTMRASEFLNKNTGWLIATAIVFFGLANLGFQKDNQVLLKNTSTAAENSAQAARDAKSATEDLKIIIAGQAKATEELKADNEQQTIILCRLILRGDVLLSDAEADDIERICKEQIQRASQGATAQGTGQSDNPDVAVNRPNGEPTAPSNRNGTPKPSNPNPPQITPPPPPAEQPGLLDRAVDGVTRLLNNIKDAL